MIRVTVLEHFDDPKEVIITNGRMFHVITTNILETGSLWVLEEFAPTQRLIDRPRDLLPSAGEIIQYRSVDGGDDAYWSSVSGNGNYFYNFEVGNARLTGVKSVIVAQRLEEPVIPEVIHTEGDEPDTHPLNIFEALENAPLEGIPPAVTEAINTATTRIRGAGWGGTAVEAFWQRPRFETGDPPIEE